MEGWSSEDETPLGKVADFLTASERARREGQLQRIMKAKETREMKKRLRERPEPTAEELEEYDEEIAEIEKSIARKFPALTPEVIRRKREAVSEPLIRENLQLAIENLSDAQLVIFNKEVASGVAANYIVTEQGVSYLDIDNMPIELVRALLLLTHRINFIGYMAKYFEKFPGNLAQVKRYMRKHGAKFDADDQLIIDDTFDDRIIVPTVGYMKALAGLK